MLNVLFEEGLTAPASYVDRLDEVASRSGVHARAGRAGERRTGRRNPSDHPGVCRRRRGSAYGRIGVSTTAWGTVAQWAVQLLNLVTGNLDRVGGTMFTSPAIDVVGRGFIGKGHHGIGAVGSAASRRAAANCRCRSFAKRSRPPEPARSGPCSPCPATRCCPRPTLQRSTGLSGLDFMASVDIYINETTLHADVILPPTSALERDHYDLVFQNFAVRNTARFTPAVFDKSRDQRHDWEIYRELALADATSRLKRKAPLKKRVLSRARLSISPTFLIGQLLRTDKSGVKITDLRRSPSGVDLGPLQPGRFPGRLFTRGKRIDAAPELVLEDLARLAEQELPRGDDLLLIGRRHKSDNNSWMHNATRLTRGRDRHQLLMHPEDLAARGIEDGKTVKVVSRVGNGRGRGAGHRRHDARGGLAPPRLRTPGRRHPDEPGRPGHRRLDQRPDGCDTTRRLRQRRPQRGTRHRRIRMTDPAPVDPHRRRPRPRTPPTRLRCA